METGSAPESSAEIILERMIRENQVSLKRLCYLYLHDEAMAEDAVQETFLKAFHSLDAFRGEANEKTYLTRIAINTCKDILRSAWFRHIDRRITADQLPRQQMIQDPDHRDVAVAVMNLPRKLREAVILYYYRGHSTQEVALILRISQPAVTGRLKRARSRLKEVLKAGEMDEE